MALNSERDLGLIRTQELLEARKIDGGEQFLQQLMTLDFQSIQRKHFQFGMKKKFYLKLFTFRQFKPDIIIHRFDHRTPGTTHGHHTSSAILSERLFTSK